MSLEHFKTYIKDIHNLGNALAVLEWDQKTYMPSGGAEARAEQIAALSKVIHQMTTADEMGRLLEAAEAEAAALPYEHDDAALVRVLRREYDQQTRIPTDLVVEFRRATSLANAAWEQARAADDFASFFPHLEKIFELTGQQAEHLGYDEHIYDALLDQYEPGMTTADVRRVFDALRAQLVPLVQQISAQHDPTRADILRRDYAPQQQAVFGQMVIQKLGYDFTRGRQDETAHPFCIPFSQNDVRITTRYAPNWLPAALFGSIHETGHALYELGGA
ncbi:MAG: carboxypeptidase M32, partial [Anaerolineales bacterium]